MKKDNNTILKKILIVDDSPEAIEVLANALKHYKCQVALNGEKAIKLLDTCEELPDLILLDVMMPGMDGYEVCRLLKEDERLKEIPVIYLSALTDTKDKVRAFEEGGVDYIEKPFQLEEVRARVDTHLKLRYFQKELEYHNNNLKQMVEEMVLKNQKIEEQNELLKRQSNLLNLSSEAIFAWDLNGGIIYWNKGAEQMYGYSSEEAIGCISNELLKTVHPSNIKDIKLILAKDGAWNGEIKHTTKEGKNIIIETTHQVIMNELCQKIVLETNRDISERKKAQEIIKIQKEQLEAVLESMNDAIVIYDKKGNGILTNAEARKMYPEINVESIIYNVNTGFEYFDLDNNAIPIENLPTRRVLSGEIIRNERIIIKYSNRSRFIEVNAVPIFDAENSLTSAVVSLHDISTIIEYQEKLKKQNKLLEAILENMQEGVVVADVNGSILSINPVALRMYGFSSVEEYKNIKNFPDYFVVTSLDGNPILLEEYAQARALRGEVFADYNVYICRKDNDHRWIGSYGGAPIYDENGEMLMTIITIRDITEVVNNERKLKKHQEELLKAETEKLEKLGTIIGDILYNKNRKF